MDFGKTLVYQSFGDRRTCDWAKIRVAAWLATQL